MELIDKDKLDSFKFRSASERMDLPVDYMVGWNDAVDGIMCNALTVEAIPIEWMKQKYPAAVNHDSVRYISKVDLLNEIIEEWRKEE